MHYHINIFVITIPSIYYDQPTNKNHPSLLPPTEREKEKREIRFFDYVVTPLFLLSKQAIS